jgi:hypothetical protein
MEQTRSAYNTLIGNPEGKGHLGDQGVDGRIILKYILSNMVLECGLN